MSIRRGHMKRCQKNPKHETKPMSQELNQSIYKDHTNVKAVSVQMIKAVTFIEPVRPWESRELRETPSKAKLLRSSISLYLAAYHHYTIKLKLIYES